MSVIHGYKKSKKILLFVTSLGIGGAERLVCNLADDYVEQGHEVVIAYLEKRQKTFKLRSKNIKLIHLGLERNYFSLISVLYRLRSLIKDFEPDIVHSHMYHPNIIARLVRTLTPVKKTICTSHSTNEGSKLRMLSYKFTDQFVDVIAAVSNDVKKVLIERGAAKASKIVTIPNGIDSNQFRFSNKSRMKVRNALKINSEQKLIVAAGRLSTPKNYAGLLASISQLLKRRDDFKLFIAGDGPLRDELLSLRSKLGLKDYVNFLGVYDDMTALLSAADIFVLSSLWEGLPLVVAEAMACQRLVVATDCGGVKEVLGECGILVKSNDNEALTKALDGALEMPVLDREEFGLKARKRIVEHFSLEANSRAYFELYENI